MAADALMGAGLTSLYGAAPFPGTELSWKIFTLGCSRHTRTHIHTLLCLFDPTLMLIRFRFPKGLCVVTC